MGIYIPTALLHSDSQPDILTPGLHPAGPNPGHGPASLWDPPERTDAERSGLLRTNLQPRPGQPPAPKARRRRLRTRITRRLAARTTTRRPPIVPALALARSPAVIPA